MTTTTLNIDDLIQIPHANDPDYPEFAIVILEWMWLERKSRLSITLMDSDQTRQEHWLPEDVSWLDVLKAVRLHPGFAYLYETNETITAVAFRRPPMHIQV